MNIALGLGMSYVISFSPLWLIDILIPFPVDSFGHFTCISNSSCFGVWVHRKQIIETAPISDVSPCCHGTGCMQRCFVQAQLTALCGLLLGISSWISRWETFFSIEQWYSLGRSNMRSRYRNVVLVPLKRWEIFKQHKKYRFFFEITIMITYQMIANKSPWNKFLVV